MDITLLLVVLFIVGAGLVAFSDHPSAKRSGFILEFVSALIYGITLLI